MLETPKWPNTECKPVHKLKQKQKQKPGSAPHPATGYRQLCFEASHGGGESSQEGCGPGNLGQSFSLVKTRQNTNVYHWYEVVRWLWCRIPVDQGAWGRRCKGALPQKHRHCIDTAGYGRHSDNTKQSWVTRNFLKYSNPANCPTHPQPQHKCS